MANDKNFKIKNGLSAKRYLLNGSTLSGSTIDLSLASVFSTTLSSDPAYTFTNPPPSGTAQAFSVEVTGGTTNYVQDSFATTLYAGNGSTQTITNGLDLSGEGGLVWIKRRSGTSDHNLFDSERGFATAGAGMMSSNTTGGSISFADYFNATSTGFTLLHSGNDTNDSSSEYVSWSFKKQAKFFDVVTYTGDGTVGRVIPHSLNCAVGTVIIKQTNASRDWAVWHRSGGASPGGKLNLTAAFGYTWVSSTSTTSITLENEGIEINGNGQSYVAYIFAHDTASDSRIKCGSYTGTGSYSSPPVVNLGWSPQWIMIKRADGIASWQIYDTTRGATQDSSAYLRPDQSQAEQTYTGGYVGFYPTSTGFSLSIDGNEGNASGDTYVYMAIRGDASTDSAITWPSSVKWPSGLAPTTPAPGTKDLFTFLTTDGGTTYYGKKAGSDIA